MSSAWIRYRHTMEAIGAHKKDILNYFSFRLNPASTLIYGVKKSLSRISSILSSSNESIENKGPPAKRSIPICMPHDSVRKIDIRHMPERMDNCSQGSKRRIPKCNVLTTV
ncbi:uncharacterized protein NPIL_134001 [Nephila pilipes]|uniref:Uncharacterized protein n=1 Tax=Nephila pilipes TaxID=299642 RepID=A0A8X6TLF0_NEPPI|nr:uncharacterized protein NPIL_134001 [Nephila pilipes]